MTTSIKKLYRRGRRLLRIIRGKELAYFRQVRCECEYHGSDYGGWNICPAMLNQQSIVYSCGIGQDISFDLSLIRRFGLQIHGFDPTPSSIEWLQRQQPLDNFTLHPIGIAAHDGTIRLYRPKNPLHCSYSAVATAAGESEFFDAPACRIQTMMERLKHKRINLLKLDIEGSEYAVIDDLLQTNLTIEQILVEFHHSFHEITLAQTQHTIEALNRHGYQIFAISESGNEYSFKRSLCV